VCLEVRESHANRGVRDSFGIAQLSRRLGEKRKYCKVSLKELEARKWESVCFFCQPGSHDEGRGDLHGVARWLMDMMSLWMIYTPVIVVSWFRIEHRGALC